MLAPQIIDFFLSNSMSLFVFNSVVDRCLPSGSEAVPQSAVVQPREWHVACFIIKRRELVQYCSSRKCCTPPPVNFVTCQLFVGLVGSQLSRSYRQKLRLAKKSSLTIIIATHYISGVLWYIHVGSVVLCSITNPISRGPQTRRNRRKTICESTHEANSELIQVVQELTHTTHAANESRSLETTARNTAQGLGCVLSPPCRLPALLISPPLCGDHLHKRYNLANEFENLRFGMAGWRI